jgi:protein-S-isoprenylcysteine O-methyltransferase Ste14
MGNFAERVFKFRSYTPLPFVVLMVIYQKACIESMLIGFAVIMIGEFFRIWGVSYAGSETRTTGNVGGTFLVVSGAYAFVRNPLYVGNMLIYFGVGIMSMALFPYLQLAALTFFFFQYSVIIKEEETFLHSKYGKGYENYFTSVPKLIPNGKKYKNPGLDQPAFNIKAGLGSEKRTLQAVTIIVLLVIIRYVSS